MCSCASQLIMLYNYYFSSIFVHCSSSTFFTNTVNGFYFSNDCYYYFENLGKRRRHGFKICNLEMQSKFPHQLSGATSQQCQPICQKFVCSILKVTTVCEVWTREQAMVNHNRSKCFLFLSRQTMVYHSIQIQPTWVEW